MNMDSRIDIIKGVHPGKFIERELKIKNLTQRALAEDTAIPYQTINAIISGRRNLTTEQSLLIEKTLGYEEGFLAILQTHFDIKQYKDKHLASLYTKGPRIRKSLFWDTNFDKINWAKFKNAVIQRVIERGSADEIKIIRQFYSLSKIELQEYKQMKKQSPRLPQDIK